MENKEINIFIENTYDGFSQPLDIARITKKAVSMTEFFLSQPERVEESCLNGYDFRLLYFDIVFCDDEKIHEINREYRGKDRPTDVISFAIFADSPREERFIFDDEINLGEIIISLDTALAQAKDKNHGNNNFQDELNFLIAHGILHLAGYDHPDEKTLAQMWELQTKMLESGTVD